MSGEWADEGASFAVLINEWIEWRDYRQLEDFYHRAGGLHFVLRADDYEDIQVTPPNYKGHSEQRQWNRSGLS